MSLIYRCRSAAVPWSSIRSKTGNGYESLELRTRLARRENFGMAPISKEVPNSLILKIIKSSRKRRKRQQHILIWLYHQQRILKVMAFAGLFLFSRLQGNTVSRFRSCRRLARNHGWWENVWSSYSNRRFKNSFRVSKKTFAYTLKHMGTDLEQKIH